MEDNVKRFLDFLGQSEGADYDTIVGGKERISDFSQHPKLIGLRTAEGPSTAAGKYQITGTTYDDFAPKLGITDFSPESQDKLALAIIEREGALDDVRAGNWKDAINKLGGRWASLPSSKYSQPKRDWSFVQEKLGFSSSEDLPEFQFGATNKDPLFPPQGPSQSVLETTEAKRQAQYGGIVNQVAAIPEAVELGFKNENSVYNFFKDQGLAQFDPNFTWTEERTRAALEGVPKDNWDYILQSGSDSEIAARRGRLMEAIKRQEQLGQMGGVGVLGTLTGALIDLPTLVGFLPVVGGTALVSRTSRLANALASGLAGAAGNVAVDAAMLKYRPLGSTDELYFSAAAGLGFGALGGALVDPVKHALRSDLKALAREMDRASSDHFKNLDPEMEALRQFGRREANVIQRKEIEDAGLEVTDKGKKILDDGSEGAGKALDDDAGAIREETAVFKRTLPAAGGGGRGPSLKEGSEVPRYPNGRPRESLSAKDLLKVMAENSLDPMVKPLAQRILDNILDDIAVYKVPKSLLPKGVGGFYDPVRHIILVNKDAPDWVQLHEISHGVTVQKLDYGAKNPNTVHGKLTREIEAAWQEARRAAQGKQFRDGRTNYFLNKNIKEFVAGLYSGKSEFTEFLAGIKASTGDSILSKVVDTIKRLLGMENKDMNLLLKSLGLTDLLTTTRLDVEIRRPFRDPSSDPAISVHLMPMDGVDVDPAMLKAVTHAQLNDIFGWSFGLEHALRKVKDLPAAKRLADKLIGTTVGYKGHAVVRGNAYDQSLKLADGWSTTVRKVAFTQFNDYFKRSGKPLWERGNVARDWNEQLGNYVRGFQGTYDKTIIATGDQIRKTLGDVVEHINNPARGTGGVKRGLTQDKYLDEAGNELLTDFLAKNDNYLPRANDVHKWDQMVQQFGREFVEDFWGGAFKSANPDVSDELAKRFGKWYAKRVEAGKKNGEADFLSEQLRGLDKEALKDSMVRSGMTETEAQELLDGMFPIARKGEGSVVSNTKQRSAIDEAFSMDTTIGGKQVTITMNNFINTDTLRVLDGYFKRMGGAIAIANHADIYKQSDIGRTILDATTVKLGGKVPNSELTKLREDFQFTFDRLLHRPIEEFSALNKGLEMWRNFNVIRLMGAAVYNQIQELSQIIGTMGWKATLRAIPQLGGLRRDLLSGKVKNPLLDDLENLIGGSGSDLIKRANFNPSDEWVRELGDTKFNRWLDKADNTLRRTADGVLKYTGMTGMMVQQKRVHAIAFTNHFMDVATKGKKMGLSKERLAWMGLSDADVKTITGNMKKFATEKTGVTGKKVSTVDFDKWAEADPDSLSKFTTAFQRESRRVVQENDLTSQIPMMGKAWAQTTFQFLNFVMQAWNKSLLFGLNHKDMATLSTVLHGAMFASLVYMARTASQMVGMSDEQKKEFADRRLSTKQIVANGFGRIAQASLIPGFIDQVSPVPIFSGMRTTSDHSDFLSSNPTLSSINTLLSMWRKGVRNTLSEDYQLTERDASSYIRLLPLNNVVGISGLYRSLIADLPKNEQVNPDQQ